MKSAMKRSMALLLTALMMLSVCALSLQMVVLAATNDSYADNKPCDCGATVTTQVVAATCKDIGGTWNTCTACGKKWITNPQLPTGEHDFSVDKSKEADCENDGSIGKFCSVCDTPSPENKTVPALGHDWETSTIPENCTEGGKVTEVCKRCGETTSTTVPATGHVHVAGDVADVDYKAPTCFEEGFVKFVCVCGDTILAKFDKLAHVTNTQVIPSSCKEVGYEAGGLCSICGHVDETKVIAKVGHTMVAQKASATMSNGEAGYQAPVCSKTGTTDGWQYEKCSVCGHEEKTTIPAQHTMVYKSTVQPNCAEEANGYKIYECSVCGTTENRDVIPFQHRYPTTPTVASVLYTFIVTDAEVAQGAVKGSDGNYYFSKDGSSVYYTEDATESYAGYTIVLWVIQQAPTKDTLGILVHSCIDCKKPANLEIQIEHENAEFVETVDPTCTEQGYDVWSCDCAGCNGGFKTNYTDPRGHLDYNGDRHTDCATTGIKVNAVAPDCSTNTVGYEAYYYCADANCPVAGLYGAQPTEIPATHDYNASTVTIPASCAFPAFVIKACTCGAHEYDLDVAADMVAAWNAKVSVVSGSTYLGHDWSAESPYVVLEKAKVEATCETPGNEAFHKCTLCGDTDSLAAIVIPVLGENFVIKDHVDSTCRQKGYTTYTCGNVDWENGETCSVHADYTVYDDAFSASNGGHKILNAIYDAATGRVDVSGATVLTAAQLIAAGVIADESEYTAGVAGSCASDVNLLHHAWYECSECGEPYFFAVKRVHTPGAYATCTDSQDCTECGEELAAVLGHDYQTVTTHPATCTTGEKLDQACTRCGATRTIDGTTGALGHSYNILAPTCTEAKVCSACGDTVAALDHKLSNGNSAYVRKTDDATCTATGLHTDTCSLCGDVQTTVIPALGHAWTVDVKIADRAADCTKYGYANIRGCANGCDEFHGENFQAVVGHNWTTQTNKATCLEDGETYQECSVCKETKDHQTLYALGHHVSAKDGVTPIQLTCAWLEGKSSTERTCINCFVEFKAADFHQYHEIDIRESCDQKGVLANYCHLCGDKEIIGVTEAIEHNYVLDKTHADYKDAQIAVGGTDVFVCQNCGDTYTEATDPLTGVVVSATATNKWDATAKIVNNGIVAYTIYIEGMNIDFYSLKIDVSFDNTKLTYIGYNLGADAMNIFGNRVNTIGTDVGAGKVEGDVTTLGFYGFNQNNTTEEKVDANLEGKQEFVTVYFRVNGNVRSDAETDVATVETSIKLGTITCLTAANSPVVAEKQDAAAISIYKLGDGTDDAVLASEDLAAIKEHIIAGTYDARLDINVDGVVTFEDLSLLAKKYVYTYTYEELFAEAIAYDPAI